MLPVVACGQGRPGLPSRRKKKNPPAKREERGVGVSNIIYFPFLSY